NVAPVRAAPMPGAQKRFHRPDCTNCSDQSAFGHASGPDRWIGATSDAHGACCRMETGVAGKQLATKVVATLATQPNSTEFGGDRRMHDVGCVKILRRFGILPHHSFPGRQDRWWNDTQSTTVSLGTTCSLADTDQCFTGPASLTIQTRCLYLGKHV